MKVKKMEKIKKMFDDYPQEVIDNAKKALKHKEENGSPRGTSVGWNRAKQLANRESLSEADVKDIHSFLSKARVYNPEKFFDRNGREIYKNIVFSAWGGDAMAKWAARTAAEIQEQNSKTDASKLATLYETIDIRFRELFYNNESYRSDTEYAPYRIYADNVLIAKRWKDHTLWKLNWTLTESNTLIFTDTQKWERITEDCLPSRAVATRDNPPSK